MRSVWALSIVLGFASLASLSPGCDEEKAQLGEECGGYTKDPIGCESGLYCCQPDPRVADIPGTCIEPTALGAFGDPCGAPSGVCCGENLWCSVWNDQTGDGTCLANIQ